MQMFDLALLNQLSEGVIIAGVDGPVPSAVNRVEGQEMRRRRRTSGDLIDMNELQVRAPPSCSQRQAAHAAEPIDADSRCHPTSDSHDPSTQTQPSLGALAIFA